MRTNATHARREDLLPILVDRLMGRGYTDIRVSTLEEYEGQRPPMIFWENTDEGFMPDVCASKGGNTYIFAVETIVPFAEESLRRIALFAAYAGFYRRHFSLIVPESALEEGLKALRLRDVDEKYIHLVRV